MVEDDDELEEDAEDVASESDDDEGENEISFMIEFEVVDVVMFGFFGVFAMKV